MSQLTRRILHGIDFEAAKPGVTRISTSRAQALGAVWIKLNWDLQNMDGPLCYPFLVDSVELRSHLIRERVFVATYWPETIARVSNNSHESKFVKSLLPLPWSTLWCRCNAACGGNMPGFFFEKITIVGASRWILWKSCYLARSLNLRIFRSYINGAMIRKFEKCWWLAFSFSEPLYGGVGP